MDLNITLSILLKPPGLSFCVLPPVFTDTSIPAVCSLWAALFSSACRRLSTESKCAWTQLSAGLRFMPCRADISICTISAMHVSFTRLYIKQICKRRKTLSSRRNTVNMLSIVVTNKALQKQIHFSLSVQMFHLSCTWHSSSLSLNIWVSSNIFLCAWVSSLSFVSHSCSLDLYVSICSINSEKQSNTSKTKKAG